MPVPSAGRRRLYLMRHGSVAYFDAEGRPLPPDTVPLDARGREQADTAGRLFRDAGVGFDRVVTSGLARTQETARRVLAAAGSDATPEHVSALDEIRGGRLADIPLPDLRRAFTAVTEGPVTADTRFLGGESIGELLDRVLPAIDALRADASWDTLLLVLHGAVNRAVLSYLLTGRRELLGGFEQSPACINILDLGSARHDVVLRASNLAPLEGLHAERRTTMEMLFDQYTRKREAPVDG